jgi:glutamate formiminotransferase/formiminotetrahydrofolate cyclodeaminase
MPQKIVECVPNFSEGCRLEVIKSIEQSISEVPGVLILDRHSDEDHNRTVITFAGKPDQVSEAAFQAIRKAAQMIDLEKHQGEHPRLGATDVVPFVPISGTSMEECIILARALGKRVGETLDIPVYLYERAALRPERVNLEDVRRGEYEALKETLGVDPDRDPDFGPRKLGPAGATIIGARPPLIAYNVYLASDDVDIAKKIARTVRQSSGGLPNVKAIGLLVEGRAQVSMNLTDFTVTPVARVQEMIRTEAEDYGTSIHHAELVGLIPQAAIADAVRWYLQLDGFTSEQILETCLYNAISDQAEHH